MVSPLAGTTCPRKGSHGRRGAKRIPAAAAFRENLQRCQSHEMTLHPRKCHSRNRHNKTNHQMYPVVKVLPLSKEVALVGAQPHRHARTEACTSCTHTCTLTKTL